MEQNRSKRRRDKYNPYILEHDLKAEIYKVDLIDNEGKYISIIVPCEIYEVLEDSERKEKTYMNEYDRHIEHFELDERALYRRSLNKPTSVENQIIEKAQFEELRDAICNLSEIQKRRLIMYFLDNMTLKQIALRENCATMSVKDSIDSAIKKLSEVIRKQG